MTFQYILGFKLMHIFTLHGYMWYSCLSLKRLTTKNALFLHFNPAESKESLKCLGGVSILCSPFELSSQLSLASII